MTVLQTNREQHTTQTEDTDIRIPKVLNEAKSLFSEVEQSEFCARILHKSYGRQLGCIQISKLKSGGEKSLQSDYLFSHVLQFYSAHSVIMGMVCVKCFVLFL